MLLLFAVRTSRETRESVHRAAQHQAEIELDGCLDRVLMTGGRELPVNEVATRARNILTGPSEVALRGKYGDEYEQTVSKRAEARRR